MSDQIHIYAELLKLVRVSLRNEHPEWVGQNGASPICDAYEARLVESLGLSNPLEDRRLSNGQCDPLVTPHSLAGE